LALTAAQLASASLYGLVMLSEEQSFAAATEIVQQGAAGDGLYVLLAGQLEVLSGELRVAEISVGESCGELALVDGRPRQATVRAVSNAFVLRLPQPAFARALARQPQLGLGLVRGLARWRRASPSGSPLNRLDTDSTRARRFSLG
jgi:CRP-like cAMP-binding protein